MKNLVLRKGTYYVRYMRDGKQVWKSLRTKDKEEAERAATMFQAVLPTPNTSPRGRQGTVTAFSRKWIRDYVELSRSPYNVKLAQQRLDTHILPAIGSIKLSELTGGDIRKLRKTLERKGLAVHTVRHILSDLRALLNVAVAEEQVLEFSPFSSKVMPKVDEPVAQVLSEEQLEAILSNCLPHWADLVLMGLYTGCRYGELRDLQWSQVRELPQPHLRLGKTSTGKTKSGKTRTVPLIPEAVAILKRLSKYKGKTLEKHPKSRRVLKSDGVHVFPYRPNYADAFVCLLVKKVKFKWHFHQLRHTFCTRMLEQGYNKESLRLWLGHSTIKLIETTYGHLTDEAVYLELQRVQPKLATKGRKSVSA